MANLKNITEVPEVEELSGAEKVLLNVDGSAKQARVDLIKPKEEWDIDITLTTNYSADEDSSVFEMPIIDAGSFDNVKTKILNGEIPRCRVKLSNQTGQDLPKVHTVSDTWCIYYYPENAASWRLYEHLNFWNQSDYIYMILTPDGTFEEYGWD